MQGLNTYLQIMGVIVGGVACGYLLRRLGILRERHAPAISMVLFMTAYPTIAFLAIWSVSLEIKLVALPFIQALSFFGLLGASLALSRLHNLNPKDRGTFLLSGTMANQGFTMGGLVCFMLLGQEGLGLAQIYVIFLAPLTLLVVFPLANYYNPRETGSSVWQVFGRGIWHPRTLAGAGLVAGLIFSSLKIPYPAWIKTCDLVKILIITGTFCYVAIIGVSFHFGRLQRYIRLYMTQSLVKFVIGPLLALLFICLFGLKLDSAAGAVALVQGFMPSGVNTVLFSNLFGLNARMASALFVVNTAIFLLIILPILSLVLL